MFMMITENLINIYPLIIQKEDNWLRCHINNGFQNNLKEISVVNKSCQIVVPLKEIATPNLWFKNGVNYRPHRDSTPIFFNEPEKPLRKFPRKLEKLNKIS